MPDMKLQFIIDAKNRTDAAYKKVHKNMDKVSDKLKKHQKAFKAMAIAGVAAMGAITLVMGTAIKEAAKAEGSYNKFNAVFGKHKDDMLAFVGDIRTRMPTATHEIVRMAANLQDLLVPLGLNRKLASDMTKGFLEVSNQIAAFNDVDPTEVIEAIGSALAGSSEPLRRFGVNALETNLETMAMKEGLLEAGEGFKDLDVNVKNQIRAQALLATIIDNSADAIAGFEENNDSFIRRQQELNATVMETKMMLGEVFLPTVDKVLKKILPLVKEVGEWIKVNPKLTKTIVIAAGAIALLVAGLGILGLILPGIFTAIGFLLSPIALVTAAVIGFAILVALNFKHIYDEAKHYFGLLASYFTSVWESIKGIFGSAIDLLMAKIQPFINAFETVKRGTTWLGGKAGATVSWLKGEGQFGIPYVPETGAYLLHKGETVTPAGAGIGGITINIMGGNYLSEDAAEMFGEEIANVLKRNLKL